MHNEHVNALVEWWAGMMTSPSYSFNNVYTSVEECNENQGEGCSRPPEIFDFQDSGDFFERQAAKVAELDEHQFFRGERKKDVFEDLLRFAVNQPLFRRREGETGRSGDRIVTVGQIVRIVQR